MNSNNKNKFMKNSAIHVANLNRNLKNTKSKVLVDFIHSNLVGITIVTNKISQVSDLTTIKNYLKNSESIDLFSLNSKQNHIFNNITLASKPRVIKVLPKSDIAIV